MIASITSAVTGPDEQDFLEIVISRHLRSADSKRNQANVTRES